MGGILDKEEVKVGHMIVILDSICCILLARGKSDILTFKLRMLLTFAKMLAVCCLMIASNLCRRFSFLAILLEM